MHSRRARFLAAAALLSGAFLVVTPPVLAGYTIYLKDGGHIQAKDKPTIQGKSRHPTTHQESCQLPTTGASARALQLAAWLAFWASCSHRQASSVQATDHA